MEEVEIPQSKRFRGERGGFGRSGGYSGSVCVCMCVSGRVGENLKIQKNCTPTTRVKYNLVRLQFSFKFNNDSYKLRFLLKMVFRFTSLWSLNVDLSRNSLLLLGLL